MGRRAQCRRQVVHGVTPVYIKYIFIIASFTLVYLAILNSETSFSQRSSREGTVGVLSVRQIGRTSLSNTAFLLTSTSYRHGNSAHREMTSQRPVMTGASSDHGQSWAPVQRRDNQTLVEANKNVVMFSAVARNTTETGVWGNVTVNAWETLRSFRTACKCCFLLRGGKLAASPVFNKTYWKKARVIAVQYICRFQQRPGDVTGVSLINARQRCVRNAGNYVKPTFPRKRKEHSIALCGKIVYGNVDPELLVDWLEFYILMKVDKILLFTYNISKPVSAVLEHYAKTGFVQLRTFDFPWKGHVLRNVGQKTPTAWEDEQVVVLDCQERLQGYSYVAIIDIDEFLMPRKAPDLKILLKQLTRQHPLAAGFTFMSHIFVKDWGPAPNTTGSVIRRYFARTVPVRTRWKNVYMPSRVVPGTVHTHEFYPQPGYTRVTLNASQVALHHYRSCYHNLLLRCRRAKRIKDHSMVPKLHRMSKSVKQTKALLKL